MTLYTDDKTILSSSSVLLPRTDERLFIPVVFNSEYLGDLCIQFLEDRSNPEIRVNASVIENKMVVQGYNFNSPIGNASVTPLNIGQINEKNLWLQFASRVMGQDDQRVREITYTMYLEKDNAGE